MGTASAAATLDRPTEVGTEPASNPEACVRGDGRPFLSSATPWLFATVTSPDGGFVSARFQWRTRGHDPVSALTTATLSGTRQTFRIPEGTAQNGSILAWRVRAETDSATSYWSPWCEYTIDTQAPDVAPGVSSEDYPSDGFHGGVGRPGEFTFTPNGVDDVVGYRYQLVADSPRTVDATGPDHSATVTLVPTSDGPVFVAVRSVDPAGNLSPITTYQFLVDSPSGPVAHWALDDGSGTVAADSSGNGHDASGTGTLSWTAGRSGGGISLGDGGALSTSDPVIRTDRAFSVTVWARPGDPSGTGTAVSQDGQSRSGFTLGYVSGHWRFAVPRADADTALVDQAASDLPVEPGVWTHLAGTYNPGTGEISLYVNGALAATAPHPEVWDATGPTEIGRAFGGSDEWSGTLDEIQVFDRVLFEDGIGDIVNSPALAGHWDLDEGTGTVIGDSSGGGHDGTLLGGADWIPGHSGTALEFDGATGHVSIGAPDQCDSCQLVDTSQSFTVAAWVRLTDAVGGHAAVSVDDQLQSGFSLGYSAAGTWTFAMTERVGDSVFVDEARASGSVQVGEWTHLAAAYNGERHDMSIYVNGVFAGSAFNPFPVSAAGTPQFGRALVNGAPGDWWAGDVDDVRLYSGVLSDHEIQALAAS